MRYQNGCGLNTIRHVTLETRRELDPKCVPQYCFWNHYWGQAVQQLASFFPCAY